MTMMSHASMNADCLYEPLSILIKVISVGIGFFFSFQSGGFQGECFTQNKLCAADNTALIPPGLVICRKYRDMIVLNKSFESQENAKHAQLVHLQQATINCRCNQIQVQNRVGCLASKLLYRVCI